MSNNHPNRSRRARMRARLEKKRLHHLGSAARAGYMLAYSRSQQRPAGRENDRGSRGRGYPGKLDQLRGGETKTMTNPTPEQIKSARQEAGLTQTAAAAVVHAALRTWQQWEAGDRGMHPGLFELFTLKTTPR